MMHPPMLLPHRPHASAGQLTSLSTHGGVGDGAGGVGDGGVGGVGDGGVGGVGDGGNGGAGDGGVGDGPASWIRISEQLFQT